jgi:hypothetical protein
MLEYMDEHGAYEMLVIIGTKRRSSLRTVQMLVLLGRLDGREHRKRLPWYCRLFWSPSPQQQS